MTELKNFFVHYCGPGCLAGITCTDWLTLMAQNGFRMSPRYLGKTAFLTVSSFGSTAVRLVEDAIYSKRLAEHQTADPVFILGSWRSGTTHLHNIFCLDDQFVSPNHTARIRMILELYPRARFIHIRRNPYDVYRSLVHMASQVIPVWGLQFWPKETIPDMVIDMYRRLYAAYFDEVSLIPAGHPAGQFHEIAYEDLTQTPVPVLEETYKALNLGDFEVRRSKIENYTMAKSGYQRNRHRDIPAEICERLHSQWRQSFEAWDYEFSKQRPMSAEDQLPARPLRSADRRQSDNAKLP